jgi:hypothetical protein
LCASSLPQRRNFAAKDQKHRADRRRPAATRASPEILVAGRAQLYAANATVRSAERRVSVGVDPTLKQRCKTPEPAPTARALAHHHRARLLAHALPTGGDLENKNAPTTYEPTTSIGVAAPPSKRAFFAGGLPPAAIFVVCWVLELVSSLRALTTTPHRGRGCGNLEPLPI